MTTEHEEKIQATSEAKHIAWIRKNTTINSRLSLFIIVCAYSTCHKYIIKRSLKDEFQSNFSKVFSS